MKLKLKDYLGAPDKQRIINAIIGEPVDRVPNFEILIEDKIIEKLLGRHIGGATLGAMDKEDVFSDSTERSRKVHQDRVVEEEGRPIHAKDYVEICEIIGQDAISIGELSAPFFKKNPDGKQVLAMDKSFKNRKDVEQNLILPTENPDYYKRIIPYVREYKEEAAKKNLGFTILCADLFTQLYENIFGLTDFSYLLYDDIALIEELLEAGIEYWLGFARCIADEGVDFIYFADDLAFKSGLFVDPKVFRKLYLDKYTKLWEPFVNKGIPLIFHSDGNVYEIMDDLIESGMQCFNPIDPYCMDYKELKKRFGKNLTLMGNINLTFPISMGKPEDVWKDVKEHMDVCKPGYRYICATSHSMVNYIPADNVVAFYDAIHEYGVY